MLRINILVFLTAAGVGACTIVLENHCGSNAGNFSCPSATPWCNSCANKTDCQLEEPEDSCKAFSPDHCASQTVEPGGADAYCAGRDGGVRPTCDGCVKENDGCVVERNNPRYCYGDDTGTGSSSGGTETTVTSGSTSSSDSTGSTGSSGSTGGPTPCVGHAECAAMGVGTDYCKPSTGECVPCLEDVHCTTDDAAACNTTTNECEACTENPDCDGVTGMDVCNDGACVQCTPGQEEACMGTVCSAFATTCTSATPGSATVCDACEADGQCADGQLCVQQVFESMSIGHFCFWRLDAPGGPNGDCDAERPYSHDATATSVEGVQTDICDLRVTTCPALADYPTKECDKDADCGVPKIADGKCESLTCTVPCVEQVDCPVGMCSGAFSCSTP